MKSSLFLAIASVAMALPAIAESPYAGQEHRLIKSLSAQEIRSLENGDGMGFAKLAELNRYPGPRHVLDLADELGLSAAQLADTEALYEEMRSNAQSVGREVIAAELALDRAFAHGDIDRASLNSALSRIGELRARLRYVHLEAHLRQKDLLTDAQVDAYDRARGYHQGHHDDGAGKQLFAVQVTVGPNWDTALAPHEQAFFKEHSDNLKQLRNAGHIVLGARYSDIGLVIFSAASADDVRAFMDKDPSMDAGTFKYEVHPFNVFYPATGGKLK
ncbi:MAG: YciI family protein [Woeseiaceae bacterium]|nr:YciI family protein [Woeseiaceae bacterium]